MPDPERHALGNAPWPTAFGGPLQQNGTQVTATARGATRWSHALPGPGRAVAVAASGRSFVATGGHLVAIDPDGAIAWAAFADGVEQPVALADGRVAAPEAKRLVVRAERDGAELASWPTRAVWSVAVTPSGDLVYGEWDGERARLKRVSLDGDERWSRPLVDPPFRPPLVAGESVIVADRSHLRAYDEAGALRWIAGRDGFVEAAGDVEALEVRFREKGDRPLTRPIGLGDGRVLAGFLFTDGGALLVVDERAKRVTLPPEPATAWSWALRPSVAVVDGGSPAVACEGGTTGAAWPDQPCTVALASLDGTVRWSRATGWPPRVIVTDGARRLFVASGPDDETWKANARNLSDPPAARVRAGRRRALHLGRPRADRAGDGDRQAGRPARPLR